jgi:hypothetical protein
MGVDSGIHIMHCLHESLADDQNLLQTSTARGVMFSSITTMSSFISLAFIRISVFPAWELPWLLAISFTLLCTLIILPAFSSRTIQLEPKTQ